MALLAMAPSASAFILAPRIGPLSRPQLYNFAAGTLPCRLRTSLYIPNSYRENDTALHIQPSNF